GMSWKRLIAAHALDEDDRGQLVRRASVEHAADLVQEMADAVANLDGLRLLAPVPRCPAFPERLTTYLEAEFPFVEPRATLTGASGSPYQVTAAAGSSEKRPVYVQTAAGQNTAAQRSAVERCFTMFSDVNGRLPTERKLVVLDDEATLQWRPEMINLLAGVAYVGTWTARDQWTKFVRGNVPESRLMLPSEQPPPMGLISALQASIWLASHGVSPSGVTGATETQ
ncbi:MAG: hypothetical protein ACRDQX_12245, partial [Pseudonocardiaceae bacterium]